MGLPGERTQYLPADHRHVCKFRDMTDPNYMVLRDCFKTTIENINRESTWKDKPHQPPTPRPFKNSDPSSRGEHLFLVHT